MDLVAFGEVWAENLTKSWPENRQIVVVRGFHWAFGEFWNPNLTKCPKNLPEANNFKLIIYVIPFKEIKLLCKYSELRSKLN